MLGLTDNKPKQGQFLFQASSLKNNWDSKQREERKEEL